MGKSLADLTAEIREINVSHGWRPVDGGPGGTTFGDYIALLHSEVSEALEAYRDHRLDDATATTRAGTPISEAKPEGVGSELADVLIRLLDMCDVFGIWLGDDMEDGLADVAPLPAPAGVTTFGEHVAWLHFRIGNIDPFAERVGTLTEARMALILRALVTVAERHGIDLTAEVERKIAYNRTRPYKHGGKAF